MRAARLPIDACGRDRGRRSLKQPPLLSLSPSTAISAGDGTSVSEQPLLSVSGTRLSSMCSDEDGDILLLWD